MSDELPARQSPASASNAMPVEVCITVDDLPVHGLPHPALDRRQICSILLDALRTHKAPQAVGFVTGGLTDRSMLTRFLKQNNRHFVRRLVKPFLQMSNVDTKNYLRMASMTSETHTDILKDWLKAGHVLGNHTYWHTNLNRTDKDTFIKSIVVNDAMLERLVGSRQRMFRYPRLAEGDTTDKRDTIRKYLQRHNYQIVPVSVDFDDWSWNHAYIEALVGGDVNTAEQLAERFLETASAALNSSVLRARTLFGRDIKHILLLHCSVLTATSMDQMLKRYAAMGVRLITVDEALTDPVYASVATTGECFSQTWTKPNKDLPTLGKRSPFRPEYSDSPQADSA